MIDIRKTVEGLKEQMKGNLAPMDRETVALQLKIFERIQAKSYIAKDHASVINELVKEHLRAAFLMFHYALLLLKIHTERKFWPMLEYKHGDNLLKKAFQDSTKQASAMRGEEC